MVERAEAGETVPYLPELRLGNPSLVVCIPRKEGGIVFYEPKEAPRGLDARDVFCICGRERNLGELKRIDCIFPSFYPESPGNYLGVKGGFSFEVREFYHNVPYVLSVYKDPLQQGFKGDLWTFEDGDAEVVKLQLLNKVYVNVFRGEAEGDVVLIPVFGKSFEHPKGILVTTSQVLMQDSGRKVQEIVKGLCSQ